MSEVSAGGTGRAAWVGRHLGMVVGLGVTAASMSSGFIWASQGKILPVYVAGFFAWTGYASAHYAVTGVFVDDMSDTGDDATAEPTPADGLTAVDGGAGDPTADWSLSDHARHAVEEIRTMAPDGPLRTLGFLVGIAVLVAGIAILAWYVRQENHLLGNVGSGMFLGGYALAHYFDTGTFL